MYLFIAVTILFLAVIESNATKSIGRNLIKILWVFLTLMLCLRYGQGTDYFNYEMQYRSIDANSDFFTNTLYHGEFGWYLILLVIKKINLDFQFLIIITSLVEMIFIRRFIDKSPYKGLSYLILLPTFYLTYCFSAMRQGLVMALFLGYGLELLVKKKFRLYFLLIVALSFIHLSAIILIILPFLSSNAQKSFSIMGIPIIALSLYISYLMSREFVEQYSFSTYIQDSSSIGGIIVRIVLAVMIIYLHHQDKSRTEVGELLYRYYLVGFSVFLAFSFTGTFSQRLTMPFKGIEVVLIPILLYQCYKSNTGIKIDLKICFFTLSLLLGVEYFKNIDSYIKQGNYVYSVNVLNYPYISIFEKNDINKYRSITYSIE